MAKPNDTSEGQPDSGDDQPNNSSWVVGAIIAIAVLAGILSLIGLWANKESVPSAAVPASTAAPGASAAPTEAAKAAASPAATSAPARGTGAGALPPASAKPHPAATPGGRTRPGA